MINFGKANMRDRIELAKYFADLGLNLGAEVGVASGYYSEILCKANPKLKLYSIDPWYRYHDYRDFANPNTFIHMEDKARKLLAPYSCIIIKKTSMEAVKDFADNSLDFVFIDANHAYEYVRDDIREWTKKVRNGGIVSGHDYYKTKAGNVGVITAVDEYIKEHKYKLELTEWTNSNLRDDRQPCWWFRK
jgi:hypothetical protein